MLTTYRQVAPAGLDPAIPATALGLPAAAAGVTGTAGQSTAAALEDQRFRRQLCNSSNRLAACKMFVERSYPEGPENCDSQTSFEEVRKRFLPIQASGIFWASLE